MSRYCLIIPLVPISIPSSTGRYRGPSAFPGFFDEFASVVPQELELAAIAANGANNAANGLARAARVAVLDTLATDRVMLLFVSLIAEGLYSFGVTCRAGSFSDSRSGFRPG